jgi:DNA-binding response OmpR family regulator
MMARIIVVKDDPGQLEELIFILNHAGYHAQGAVSANELDQYLCSNRPDIALLDYNLPDATGAEIAARLRGQFGQEIGIVMITARSQGVDRVECRRAGVNDYLVKPVDFSELLAVVKNLLAYISPDASSRQDAWQILPSELMIVPPGAEGIGITFQESLVLMAFAAAPEQMLSRDEMIRVLGHDPHTYDVRALETIASRIRKKLPALPDGRSPLQSVRGVGYKFIRQLIVNN